MNKYEKIQKLQTLKENGTITQNEFDIEKAKVLNENNNQNKKNHFGIIILCAIVIILGSGIVANIIISNNIEDKALRKQHVKDILAKVNNDKKLENNMICPKCGNELVERNGKYGKFIGCSDFHKCKYIKK